MEPSLIALLEEARAERLADELKEKWRSRHKSVCKLIDKRLNALSLDTARPPATHVAMQAPVQALLLDTPIDEEITDDMLDRPLEDLPAIIELWLVTAKTELVGLLQNSDHYKDDAALADLELATVAFMCKACYFDRVLFYPEVLYHQCCTSNRSHWIDRLIPEKADTTHGFVELMGHGFWSAKCLRVRWTGEAKLIVKACGLDPEVTTAKDMHRLDPLLEHWVLEDLAEDNVSQRRSVFTWRHAMKVIFCSSS